MRHVSPLQTVQDFLLALVNSDKDGRVLLRLDPSTGQGNASLHFLLLNPAVYFAEVLEQAGASCSSGTMSPVRSIMRELGLPRDTELFTCGTLSLMKTLSQWPFRKDPRGQSSTSAFRVATHIILWMSSAAFSCMCAPSCPLESCASCPLTPMRLIWRIGFPRRAFWQD